jgi:predicted transcriptional regulator
MTKKVKEEKHPKFRYESIIQSAWITRVDKDLLKVLLDKERSYTHLEVQQILEKEKKRVIR